MMAQPVKQSADDDEQVEPRIIRLRLRRAGLGMEGIARTFAAADRILLDWCARLHGDLVCEYEIVHTDGRLEQGRYPFRAKNLGRPALERYLQRIAMAPDCAARPAPPEQAAPAMIRRRIRLPAYRAGSCEP